MAKTKTRNIAVATLLLRSGLAFCFLYAAVAALKHPRDWLDFVPHFTTKFVAAETSLKLLSLSQIALALWLLSGKWLRYAAAIAFAMLAGIVLLNLNLLIFTFRDVGLSMAALALLFLDL